MTHKKKLIEVALPLAAVLNTPRAIEVSVFVVRAFVRGREILTSHKAAKADLGERPVSRQGAKFAKRKHLNRLQVLKVLQEIANLCVLCGFA